MRGFRKHSVTAFCALAPAALFAALMQPQESSVPAMHVTTQERLETEPWWPTMGTAPLEAFAGSASCKACHAEQTSSPLTAMQRAATRASETSSVPRRAPAAFKSGPMTYSLDISAPLRLSASNGSHRATQAIEWVVGAGNLGQTFLYNADGHWYQSEISFYTVPSILDTTTGFAPSTNSSPREALGNLLSPTEARACFGCHTVHATTSAGLNPLHAEAGIGCEGCHGPGARHGAMMAAKTTIKKPTDSEDPKIFQPAKLSPADSIDFCASCHRSFADASLSVGPHADKAAVRFQPFRLEESKCWRTTQDERLTCVACHDPHKPLNRDAASYDSNCLGCHSGVKHAAEEQHMASVCPKAKHDCVTCHMPKVNLASMHGDFTDHNIRIMHDGELPPQ